MTYDLLDGVTVVELAMYAFAPSCGAVLADWGADVVRIERGGPVELADYRLAFFRDDIEHQVLIPALKTRREVKRQIHFPAAQP